MRIDRATTPWRELTCYNTPHQIRATRGVLPAGSSRCDSSSGSVASTDLSFRLHRLIPSSIPVGLARLSLSCPRATSLCWSEATQGSFLAALCNRDNIRVPLKASHMSVCIMRFFTTWYMLTALSARPSNAPSRADRALIVCTN